ncbi:MAG: LysM peptidoglycan-binding domain-containing protein [Desulfobacterales bacterium]|nr:LysM peptidoglycan-binding domain-containing protein [Desulfobacterales bacterium]
MKILIIVGESILVLVLFIFIVFWSARWAIKGDLGIIEARLSKLSRIEEALSNSKSIKDKISSLEEQGRMLMQKQRDSGTKGGPLKQQVDNLSRRIDLLNEKISALAIENKRLAAAQKKSAFSVSLTKKRYHEVKSGETIYQIAKKYGITPEQLISLNNLTENQTIYPRKRLVVEP